MAVAKARYIPKEPEDSDVEVLVNDEVEENS